MLRPSTLNPSIGAGELVHPIVISRPDPAGDSYGASVVASAWLDVRTTRAAISTLTGRELVQASTLVSEASHVVTIRWTAAVIRAGYRVQFGSRSFRVQYVDNVDERNRVIRLFCLEVNA